MSSEAVYKAGDTGTVKVGRNTITVQIVAKDASGWRVRNANGKEMTVRNFTPLAPAPQPKAASAASRADKDAPAARKTSLFSAALAVLGESEEAMNCRAIVAAAKERGLWTPGAGKTPEQTLYSAFTREMKTKGAASRVRLASPGHFALAR